MLSYVKFNILPHFS